MRAHDAKAAVQTALGVKVDGDIGPLTRRQFDLLATTDDAADWPPTVPTETEKGEPVGTIGGVQILRAARVAWFTSKAAIDIDGSPFAYHRDPAKSRDYLANAGHPGNWWGIVTDTDHLPGKVGKGTPLIQGETAPAFSPESVGYYVSCTALADNPEYPISDVRRYCNPEEVPGFVLPANFPIKVRLGAVGRVSYQGRSHEAVFFDVGGPTVIGEIGKLLADLLGIPSDPKKGGVPGGVRFEIPLL